MATIIDIDNTTPTVESVVTRLFYAMKDIKSITCIVEWEDGETDWCGSEKSIKDMAHHSMLLQRACLDLYEDYIEFSDDE
jgi:hypothetical protein